MKQTWKVRNMRGNEDMKRELEKIKERLNRCNRSQGVRDFKKTKLMNRV